jgi:hypothetical protein
MTDNDLNNRELSIEELEAIAAGWPSWVHSVANFVSHEVSVGLHYAAEGAAWIAKYVKLEPWKPGPGKL